MIMSKIQTADNLSLQELRIAIAEIQDAVRYGKTYGNSSDIHTDVEQVLLDLGLDVSEAPDDDDPEDNETRRARRAG